MAYDISIRSSKVWQTLDAVYDTVQTLEDFCLHIITVGSSDFCNKDVLVQENDNQGYHQFMQTTLVASHQNSLKASMKLSDANILTQSDVLVQTIERVKKKDKGKNVLSFGCNSMSNNLSAQVCGSMNFEYSFPNQNISVLLQAHWKTLLERIGDEKMLYLLESRAIYAPVTETCYIQVTGVPIYEMWPYNKILKCELNMKARVKKDTRSTPSNCNAGKQKQMLKSSGENKRGSEPCVSYLEDSEECGVSKRLRLSDNLCSQTSVDCDLNDGFCEGPSADKDATIAVVETKNAAINETLYETSIDFEGNLEKNRSIVVKDDAMGEETATHNENKTTKYFNDKTSQVEAVKNHDVQTVVPNSSVLIVKTGEEKSDEFKEAVGTVKSDGISEASKLSVNKNSCHTVRNTGEKLWSNTKVDSKERLKLNDARQRSGEKTSVKRTYKYHTYFNRIKTLYCKHMKEAIVAGHVLDQQSRSSERQVSERVVEEIVKTNVTEIPVDLSTHVNSSHQITQRLESIFEELLKNHRKFDYVKVLSYYSPLSRKPAKKPISQSLPGDCHEINSGKCKKQKKCHSTVMTSERAKDVKKQRMRRELCKLSLPGLLASYIPSRQIYLLVRRLYLNVVPVELLGSKDNQKAMLEAIYCLVKLGRRERFCVGQVVSTLKTSHCKWLPKRLPHHMKEIYLAKVVYWLIDTYIFTLLKSFLYITDTTVFRNRLFYYRKSVWQKISEKAIAAYVGNSMLSEVSEAFVKSTLQSGHCLGVASLRLMPKASSVRPITNMNKKVLWGPSKGSSINRQLQNLFEVLRYEKGRDKGLVGSSQFGAADVHDTWRQFVALRKHNADQRPVYMVKLDLENCFDSIDQTRLYRYLEHVLNQNAPEEYLIRRYAFVHLSANQIKRHFEREVSDIADFQPDFFQYVREKCAKENKRDAIFVDQVLHMHETKASLLQKLRTHLFCTVIQIGKKYYRKMVGISQGSILSAILCNYYYGQMESEKIHVNLNEEVLLRQVDDFLFVTPDHQRALQFLHLMLYDLAEYSCTVSRHKSLINFETKEQGIQVIQPQALFPWCGYLINPVTLEVVTDYSRYAGLQFTDIITCDVTQHPANAMITKLQQSLPQKNQWICLDPDINSDDTMVTSLYKVFMMTAAKFHVYVKRLKLARSNNTQFLLDLVEGLCHYAYNEVRYRLRQVKRRSYVLHYHSLNYICLQAFQHTLNQYSGQYGKKFKTQLKFQILKVEKNKYWSHRCEHMVRLMKSVEIRDCLHLV